MVYIKYECYFIQEMKGENEMKTLLSKESAAIIALLMLLSLQAFASATMLVNAVPQKGPNVIIDGSGSVEITWKSSKSKTYCSTTYAKLTGLDNVAIIPNHGYHIDYIYINDILQVIVDEDGFSLVNVKDINTISVKFVDNGGEDDVNEGTNVEAYPDPDIGLIFDNVEEEGGWAYADTIELQYPGQKSLTWDIRTTAKGYEYVTVYLVLDLTELLLLFPLIDPYGLELWITEFDILRLDFNLDGIIDGNDVSIVANANPSESGDSDYDPKLDLNPDGPDGVIDDEDVNIVNNYNGMSVWEDITTKVDVDYDLKLVYVYGETEHFSIFGVH